MTFKVGDKVQTKEAHHYLKIGQGQVGTVVDSSSDNPDVIVDFGSRKITFHDTELEPLQCHNLRPLGDVLLEMEILLLEMIESHDLQHGDILNLIRGYLEVHCPGAREEYTEGGSPEFYYGPKREDG